MHNTTVCTCVRVPTVTVRRMRFAYCSVSQTGFLEGVPAVPRDENA
jgi:hypothetical protein